MHSTLLSSKLGVIIVSIGLLLVASSYAKSAEIEGVVFANEIQASEDPSHLLRVHGMGLLRYRVVFRGYVAALYLPDGIPGERALEDVPRRLELSYFWSIAGSDFARAANQLLARELTTTQLASLRPRIDDLHRSYKDVRPDDRYSLTYLPSVGTELRLNDELLTTIPGNDFAEAYFGIWLGKQPLDVELRDQLLGRS